MAITHTRTLQRVEVYPERNLMVVYVDTFDDPEDDLLPSSSNKIIHIPFNSDVSSHLQMVQDVAAGAWTNISVSLAESNPE